MQQPSALCPLKKRNKNKYAFEKIKAFSQDIYFFKLLDVGYAIYFEFKIPTQPLKYIWLLTVIINQFKCCQNKFKMSLCQFC